MSDPPLAFRRHTRLGPTEFSRPAPAIRPGKQVGVRLKQDQLAALDSWIAKQPKPISRPEAIRSFLAVGLHLVSRDPAEFPGNVKRDISPR
jgi:hypothetical protein